MVISQSPHPDSVIGRTETGTWHTFPVTNWLSPTFVKLEKALVSARPAHQFCAIWVLPRRMSYWFSHQEGAVLGHLCDFHLNVRQQPSAALQRKKRSREWRAGAESLDSVHGRKPGSPQVCACWRHAECWVEYSSGPRFMLTFFTHMCLCFREASPPNRCRAEWWTLWLIHLKHLLLQAEPGRSFIKKSSRPSPAEARRYFLPTIRAPEETQTTRY